MIASCLSSRQWGRFSWGCAHKHVAPTLFVAANKTHQILVFSPAATGGASAQSTLSGPQTTLRYPSDIAIDSSGRIIVANEIDDSIAVFAPTASGNAVTECIHMATVTRMAVSTSFNRVVDAHRRIERGHVKGKIVLRIRG